MTALPAHVLDAGPDDCPGTLYRVEWVSGVLVVGFHLDTYDHSEIVTPIQGLSVHDNETHAVQTAAMGLLVGLVQHRLDLGDDVSDDDLRDALAAATTRGDLDLADLLDLATARGIGQTGPAPAVVHMGYRH